MPRVSALKPLLATLLVVPFITMCGTSPWEHGPIEEIFVGQQLPDSIMLDTPLGDMHVVSTGLRDNHAPQLIFIHGSPGGWDGWVHYLADEALQRHATLIAVDRPGFGSSTSVVEPRLAGQSAALAELLKKRTGSGPVILVGHSLGGPIALQLAAEQPDKVDGVLLLAASLDPALEEPRWYNKLADNRLFRWAIPDAMLRSNEEMMVLSDELSKQEKLWAELLKPGAPAITLMQGETDDLVYPENADYAEEKLPAPRLRVVRLEDSGHFFIWEQRELVIEELLLLLKRISN